MFSFKEVVILGFGTVVMVALGSFSAFVGWQAWKFKDEFWLKSRWNHHTLLLIHTLTALYVTLRCPALVWVDIWIGQKEFDELSTYQKGAKMTLVVVTAAYNFSMVIIAATRFWHHYYSANLAVAVGVAKWKQMIDKSLVTDSSWFLRHQKSYGNRQRVFRWAAALCLLLTVFASAIAGYSLTLYTLSLSAAGMAGIAMAVLLKLKYPSFKDRIFLVDEAQKVGVALFCYLCVWLPLVAYESMSNAHGIGYALIIVGTQVLNCVMFVGLQFVMSNLVIAKFVAPSKVACGLLPLTFSLSHRLTLLTPTTMSRLRTLSSVSQKSRRSSFLKRKGSSKSIIGNIRVYDVLRSKTGFRLFMAHLFKEFSTENMLCLIECAKFKNKLKTTASKFDIIPEEEKLPPESKNTTLTLKAQSSEQYNTEVFSLLEFCEDVRNTQSTTVSKLDGHNTAEVAQELAAKYILLSAPQCVNLSGRARVRVLRRIDAVAESGGQLQEDVFDQVISQCMYLLNDSFSRFQSTGDFATLLEEYQSELRETPRLTPRQTPIPETP